MKGFRDTFLFNVRVLEEGGPASLHHAPEGAQPDAALRRFDSWTAMAFSPEAATWLERAEIPILEDAGGISARIEPAALERLRAAWGDQAEGFCCAVEEAFQGWSRNVYVWELAEGRILSLGGRPRIMGILNVTPDSFSDGGLYVAKDAALARARALIAAGAEILDIGGESTRPGAEPVSAGEEIDRTVPVIQKIFDPAGPVISIDTTKTEVAAAALKAGASIINDISGLAFDQDMIPLAEKNEAGVVIMHIKGTPRTMQNEPHYDDTLADIALELRRKILGALEGGIAPQRIVIDPGIGFGKWYEDNLRLLAGLGELRSIGFPLLLGSSRKSFLGRISGRDPSERVLETAATSVIAALAGVQIVRVHDVEENLRALKVCEAVLSQRR
ncbi:MAG: dihydropteroate synthase [Planctomycetota bacterium]|jgi:dihydropteroate synthase